MPRFPFVAPVSLNASLSEPIVTNFEFQLFTKNTPNTMNTRKQLKCKGLGAPIGDERLPRHDTPGIAQPQKIFSHYLIEKQHYLSCAHQKESRVLMIRRLRMVRLTLIRRNAPQFRARRSRIRNSARKLAGASQRSAQHHALD